MQHVSLHVGTAVDTANVSLAQICPRREKSAPCFAQDGVRSVGYVHPALVITVVPMLATTRSCGQGCRSSVTEHQCAVALQSCHVKCGDKLWRDMIVIRGSRLPACTKPTCFSCADSTKPYAVRVAMHWQLQDPNIVLCLDSEFGTHILHLTTFASRTGFPHARVHSLGICRSFVFVVLL